MYYKTKRKKTIYIKVNKKEYEADQRANGKLKDGVLNSYLYKL